MIGGDAEHIAFASLAQIPLDVADAVDRIACDPGEGDARRNGARDHLRGKLRLR